MALVDTDNLLKRFSRYLRLERGLSENTIAGYMSDVEKLVDFIDSENLDWRTVTGADLHQFVATLQDLGIGARSQARIISGIKSFFNFLRMEKCIHTNPSELIETPKLGMKLPVVTIDEEKSMKVVEDYMEQLHPVAFELCYRNVASPVPARMERRLAGKSLIWYNTLWASLAGGHDDEAARKDPDASYGYLINKLGARILQTDSPAFMLDYLRSKGWHD